MPSSFGPQISTDGQQRIGKQRQSVHSRYADVRMTIAGRHARLRRSYSLTPSTALAAPSTPHALPASLRSRPNTRPIRLVPARSITPSSKIGPSPPLDLARSTSALRVRSLDPRRFSPLLQLGLGSMLPLLPLCAKPLMDDILPATPRARNPAHPFWTAFPACPSTRCAEDGTRCEPPWVEGGVARDAMDELDSERTKPELD